MFIAAATLLPSNARGASIAWCIRCGDFWLSDAIGNVVLFVPLGVALAAFGWSAVPAVATAAALSLGIESLQYAGLPPGRTTSLSDWLMNTSGAFIGAGVAARLVRTRAARLSPPQTGARRLAAWTAATAAMAIATMWLLTPVPRHRRPAGATPPAPSRLPHTPGYGWYSGLADSAVVNGVRVPHGGTGPVIVEYGSNPIDTIRGAVRVRGDDVREGVVPVLYVHPPEDPRPSLLIGQQQDRAIVRSTLQARSAGLEAPDLVAPTGFRRSPGAADTIRYLEGTARRGQLSLVIRTMDERVLRETLLLSPGLGWTLIQRVIRIESPLASVASTVWLLLWSLPGGYWAAAACSRATPRPLTRLAGVVWGLAMAVVIQMVSAALAMPGWLPSEFVALLLGATAGSLLHTRDAGAIARRAGYLPACSDP